MILYTELQEYVVSREVDYDPSLPGKYISQYMPHLHPLIEAAE